jgi:hypothetical protein
MEVIHAAGCPLREGLLQHLIRPRSLIVWVKEDVGVPFDEAGQQSCSRELEHPRAIGAEARSDFDDQSVADPNGPPLVTLSPVEHPIRPEQRLYLRHEY